MLNSVFFGTEQLGGHNWGSYDLNAVKTALNIAFDFGIRNFDTADCYGNGSSEIILGDHFFKKRNDVFIATKFGVRINDFGKVFFDSSNKWCKQALYNSLKRLKTDYIDLYQMHYWDGLNDIEDTIVAFENLKKEGLIINYGFCNLNHNHIKYVVSKNIYSYSSSFSLIENSNEFAGKITTKNGVKFLPYGVLGQGILTGKYNLHSIFPNNDRRSMLKYKNFHGEGLIKSLLVVDELTKISINSGFSPAQLSIIWVSHFFNNTIPIIGIKNADQIKSLLDIIGINIDENILFKLNNIYRKFN